MRYCRCSLLKTVSGFAILLLLANKTTPVTADPLQIVFTDQPNQITIGSEVHLTCVVGGGNDPHVTWISPTGLLPVNSLIANGGRTLLITNYDITDNGQYICIASDGQEFANHVFTLNAQHSESHPTTMTSTTTTTHPKTTTMTTTTTHLRTTSTTSTAKHNIFHGTGMFCMNCKNLVNPHECHVTTRCGSHEQCYIEKFARHNLVWYDMGCRSSIVCNAMSAMSGALVGKREVKGHTQYLDERADVEDDGRMVVCEACCNNTSCNNGGSCGVEALRAPPSIISVTVQPTYYQYGDDVVLTCIVTSYPAPDYIG
ncbi:uncharacterized protein LOC111113202 [Crassostrea virginica]|uniref:Uncharacterized protein LOC111113202 isoform X2 n=1 Tax=Crassostrea virginica TaxID=6565 RepID=A0A8B8BUH8_CRAVI|nr:uncharacterized protein LOC111113202 isoform X2 [Crassostrea virginica]